MAREKAEFNIPTLSILLALITSTIIYFIPRPISTQFYENYSESYQIIEVSPRVFIYLDPDSSITIRRNEPIQIELIRGEAFFDIQNKSKTLDQLEVPEKLHQLLLWISSFKKRRVNKDKIEQFDLFPSKNLRSLQFSPREEKPKNGQ
ncbi:MAG: hypothetical protein IPJ05_04860 [Nitrosomonas sp.]|nr:hypothetical protein [Nitrosomonas sp.]